MFCDVHYWPCLCYDFTKDFSKATIAPCPHKLNNELATKHLKNKICEEKSLVSEMHLCCKYWSRTNAVHFFNDRNPKRARKTPTLTYFGKNGDQERFQTNLKDTISLVDQRKKTERVCINLIKSVSTSTFAPPPCC